jgi:glycoprotein endo-alpha-1,2-mannosidase
MRALVFVVALAALFAPAAAAGGPGGTAMPRTAIFYYPWYGTPARDGAYQHWAQNHHAPPADIASAFYPARGAYSSSNMAVLKAQMREIAAAGVQEVVSSWWGSGSLEDRRLSAVIAAARAARLALGIHVEPYAGRTVATVGVDIARLRTLGITDFFVYSAADLPAFEWAQLNSTLAGVRVFAQTPYPGYAAAGRFTGLYTYDILDYGAASFARICAEAHRLRLLCGPSVGPGYDATRATGDMRVKPRFDGATYDSMWKAALRAGADLVTITSYDEWNEGTQIEPASTAAPATYQTYAGAYGLRGTAAQSAYLDRTAYWTAEQRAAAPTLGARSPQTRSASGKDRWRRGGTKKFWRCVVVRIELKPSPASCGPLHQVASVVPS